jgi:hypothetical protein
MPFCMTCGTANAEQAKFCIRCGALMPRRPQPITVFYSYSHKDEDLRNQLEAHLAPLRRSGLIREWYDRKIIAGQDWDKEISKYLESAEVILFLISADFVNSSYIFDVEVKRALERQSAGQAAVVPVILRPVVWKIIPELGRLQALPEGARPVTEWLSPDLAFVSICEGIVALVISRSSSASEAPGYDVFSPHPTTSRSRRRVLDAALPARVPLTKPSTLLVLIRRTDSAGLRAIVEAEPEYDISAKDIDSQPVSLKFPVDKDGVPQALDLNVRIESPQFEPRSQSKNIKVPPRGDSLPRVFFLTPTQVGPLLVNVEICHGDEIIAGCVLHSVGVEATSAPDGPTRQSVASASLGMSSEDAEEKAKTLEITAIFGRKETASRPPSAPAPPAPASRSEKAAGSPPAPASPAPFTLHEPVGPPPAPPYREVEDELHEPTGSPPRAPVSMPGRAAGPPPASGGPPSDAHPVSSSRPKVGAGIPPPSPRRSLPLFWVTGVAATLFVVVLGVNLLTPVGSSRGFG